MAQRTFTVGVPEELFDFIEKSVESQDLSRNGLVRAALEFYLQEFDGYRPPVRPVKPRWSPEELEREQAAVSELAAVVESRPKVPESPLVRRGSEVPRPVRVKPPARPKGKG